MSEGNPSLMLVALALCALIGCQSERNIQGHTAAPVAQTQAAYNQSAVLDEKPETNPDEWTLIDSNLETAAVEINGDYLGNTPMLIHDRAWRVLSQTGISVVVKDSGPQGNSREKFFFSWDRRPRRIIFDILSFDQIALDAAKRHGAIAIRPKPTIISSINP